MQIRHIELLHKKVTIDRIHIDKRFAARESEIFELILPTNVTYLSEETTDSDSVCLVFIPFMVHSRKKPCLLEKIVAICRSEVAKKKPHPFYITFKNLLSSPHTGMS